MDFTFYTFNIYILTQFIFAHSIGIGTRTRSIFVLRNLPISFISPPSVRNSPILLASGSHGIAYYSSPGECEFRKHDRRFRGLIFSRSFGLKNVKKKNMANDNRRGVSYSSAFAVAGHAHYNIAFDHPVRTGFGRIDRVGFQIKYVVCNLRTDNRLQRCLGSVENSKFDYVTGERIFFLKKKKKKKWNIFSQFDFIAKT